MYFWIFFIKQTDEVESLLIIRSNVTHHSRSANCVPGTFEKLQKIPMGKNFLTNSFDFELLLSLSPFFHPPTIDCHTKHSLQNYTYGFALYRQSNNQKFLIYLS